MGRTKTKPKIKEPVKLRQKPLKNGGYSLYLDRNLKGSREYEFLELYLVPENTPNAKARNAEILELAHSIQAKRISELQNDVHGFSNNKVRAKADFLDYILIIAKRKKENAISRGKNPNGIYMSYLSLHRHLKQYKGNKINFQQVDKAFCMGFIEYLRTIKDARYGEKSEKEKLLGQNTQFDYFGKLKTALNNAVEDDIISRNPVGQIRRENKPKIRLTEIEYLTNDEINTLAKTPYEKVPNLKRAFLFSCYTGLRFSDIENLTWGNLRKNDEGRMLIKFVQQKTSKPEYPPISDKAVRWLPEKGMATDKDNVFVLHTSRIVNEHLRKWAKLAKIKKHMTFHVSRHTAATLLLSNSVPVTTVQKILGHTDIQTTLRYAKVIDKNISDAVDILDNLPD
jgi:integrase